MPDTVTSGHPVDAAAVYTWASESTLDIAPDPGFAIRTAPSPVALPPGTNRRLPFKLAVTRAGSSSPECEIVFSIKNTSAITKRVHVR
jgi:hypothetical protein